MNIKICTSGIDHTPNGYYSELMAMGYILFLRKGRDETTKTYYRRFETSISSYEISKCTVMTHVEPNITYAGGAIMTTSPRGFKQCAYSCNLILNDTQGFGMNQRTAYFWVRKTPQRLQPPHMTYCAVTRIRHHNAKHTHQPGQWSLLRVKMQTTAIQSQETMEDNFSMSHDTNDSKWYIMQETALHQKLTIAHGQNQYNLYSPWQKKEQTYQKLTSYCILSYTRSIIISVRNRDLVQDIHDCDKCGEIQEYTNKGNQDYSYRAHYNATFEVLKKKKSLANLLSFPQWRASSVSP